MLAADRLGAFYRRLQDFVEGDAIVIHRLAGCFMQTGRQQTGQTSARSSESQLLNITKWLQGHEYASPLFRLHIYKKWFFWWFSVVLFKRFCL